MSHESGKPIKEVPRPWVFNLVKSTAARKAAREIEITQSGVENVPLSGSASAEANHRNDKYDILAIGWVLQNRRTPFYPAKSELNHGLKGWLLKNGGALYFDRDDDNDRRRVNRELSQHVANGHMALSMIEGTSKNTGQQLGSIYDGATRMAINNDLDEIILIGVGGSDMPFIYDSAGDNTLKREKPSHIHIEIGSLSTRDFMQPYRQAEKSVPIHAKKAFHHEVVVPSLQQIVDIAYERAA